ncbi:MAG: alkaline shock response membrane anchor protein AmaP [Desulfotomaculaceae bacterium]|nr:alkaline shock response membrane anchor protein AmaP [Desulfotomaculaceae bacterium]
MGPFDRTLLAIYAVFLTLIFLLFSSVMLGWTAPLYLLRDLFYPGRSEVFWPLMLILIFAGIRLLWVAVRRPGGKDRHVILAESALGQVNISLQAIESLVVKVVGQVNGIREVKPKIVSDPQGVGIQVRAVVTPDINIPEVSSEIQQRIKERVFEVTGVTVSSVKVFIENIAAHRPRVE